MVGKLPARRLRIIEAVEAAAQRRRPRNLPIGLKGLAVNFYRGVGEEDLGTRTPTALAELMELQVRAGLRRRHGEGLVGLLRHGTSSFVSVITDDMPFLVDSVGMVLAREGLQVSTIVHPVLRVERDRSGRLKRVAGEAGPGRYESWQLIEVDSIDDPRRAAGLERALRDALEDVRASTEDWQAMRERACQLAQGLRASPRVRADRAEASALLDWMADNHFTFLGYREYRLERGRARDRLVPRTASGLGLMRAGRRTGKAVELQGEVREFAHSAEPLIITKANAMSTVHRATHLDYVGLKTFDSSGQVTGECRFIGLWTSTAYSGSPRRIPVLRHKVDEVVRRFGLDPASHDGKSVLHVLEAYPRDELFQASVADLVRIVRAIVNLYERSRVRLLVRRDPFGRFYSCLVFVPRDRYNTGVRERIESLLMTALEGLEVESQVQLSASRLARLHLLVRVSGPDAVRPDLASLEQSIEILTHSWEDRLGSAMRVEPGLDPAARRRYLGAFPAAYQEDTDPGDAISDLLHLEQLRQAGGRRVMRLQRVSGEAAHQVHFKLFSVGKPMPISDALPAIENLGLRLISERPYELNAGGDAAWIQDFELQHDREVAIDLATDGPRVMACLERVWAGDCENDGFNRLVLEADLDWRQVNVLRCYGRWFVQLGLPLSQSYMQEALSSNPAAASRLVALFEAQFDPALTGPERRRRTARERAAVISALERITRGDEDRIVRSYLAAIEATLRTTFYRRDLLGQSLPYLAVKLEPGKVPEVPAPRPALEIFVHSPRLEGVHLRMGAVARGGLRWSDRKEDFRTEVLGLMKAQNVKNAVIVPVGAKGGFVPRRLPPGRDAAAAEGEACYRLFIRSLLDLTDNLVDGRVVAPADVVRRDGEDPYLVVAADKGTATFSDIANAIAGEYGFWLGDAFASGGSAGYDHKKMGITARGAWECVKRHFRELGRDIQAEDFTAIGIGDMSGDVFGNGMLLSRHTRLLAAFNHQHIFIDPAPDAASSYRERERLFRLPRSTWSDYDPALISAGGGVYSRQAKSIPLAPEARRLLGIEAPSAPPREVIRAILKLEVDLLWNGGIGTYVKASDEAHAEVGDRANEAIRINGDELRCRVVGEGGNLGLSQRGRVEYALHGGRLNTDFIDNSGGVNCSDVEVNTKILLGEAVRTRRLRRADRDRLLARMTDEVAELVLRNNYLQGQALSVTESRAAEHLSEHARIIRVLERAGRLDRQLEALPGEEELEERRRLGKGLTRPELATVLSVSKLWLSEQLKHSDVPEDSYLGSEVTRYFPRPLQQRFSDLVARHPLRREIIVTSTTNSMVNRMGPVFAIRTAEDTGADIGQIARAYAIAREITRMRDTWAAIEVLDNRCPTESQLAMLHDAANLLRYLTYWVLSHCGAQLDIEAAVSSLRPGLDAVLGDLPGNLRGLEADHYAATLGRLVAADVPPELAGRVAGFNAARSAIDIVDLAGVAERPLSAVCDLYFELGDRLDITWIREQAEQLPHQGHWQAAARTSLREECYALQRRIAEVVIAASPKARPSFDTWYSGRRGQAEHLQRVIQDMRGVGAVDFATLSVALQSLRRLVA
ncbi:MAG: NAD-glutamate dehydrogenase [Steroidobacteraceae bacterium]